MAPAIALILKAAASSILTKKVQEAVTEKVTNVARDKLGLPKTANEDNINAELRRNPDLAFDLQQEAIEIRLAEEQTQQEAIRQQALSERVALKSESAFVRNARPSLLYLGGLSCFTQIVFGLAIVWTKPEELGNFVSLVSAVSGPLMALLAAGGVYTYVRSNDKKTEVGL